MRAVQLTAFGNPVDGLKYVDIPEPDPPGPNQALIGIEYSPVNPNDLMVAQGTYAVRPPLPAVIGNEGLGRVLTVGPGVGSVKVGDRVLAPLGSFTWRERMVVSAGGLSALPPDADPQQLAMLGINPPTAALLLSEYVDLKPGEWVVQNAANSGVGRWVIAFAKTRGLKTVNIVRRRELVAELEAIGGDVVVVHSPDVPDTIKAAVGQAELRLALDGVSGPATGVLAATLSPRGTLVSFAAMSEGPMSISPLDVIFKPLTMRGFWLGHREIAAKIVPAIAQAAEMIAFGRVHIPVAATYPLSSIKDAVAHAQRGGKILLDVAGIVHLTSEWAFDMATTIKINGVDRTVDVDGDTPLLWVLRDVLGMTGTKFGCGMALCGACTVHVDGVATRSCKTTVDSIGGSEITTIEAIGATPAGAKIQKAWLDREVVQCGYCQSGQIMSASALLAGNPHPTDSDIDDAMSGNICRCGTYVRIRQAIKEAAQSRGQGG